MLRKWAFWRRVQYGSAFLALCALIIVPVYLVYFVVEPTCTDGFMNGDERGVDCGGSCFLICAFDIAPPTIVWAESFKVLDGQYNAVAYIENTNREVGTPELSYIFKLYDDEGLITERAGVTVLPPDGVYPIFEGRIQTEGRIPTRTTIEFDTDTIWRPGEVGRDQFTLDRRELRDADSLPRLVTQLSNTSLDTARDVEIVAVIFDSQKRPLTASRTFLTEFEGRTSEEVVLTWPHPIAKTVRSCEIPTDIMMLLDRSGSMAADGGSPPEPLESAKQAAAQFVARLKDKDQVGYLSYATEPSSPIEQSLTQNRTLVEEAIQKTILGIDGIQYTNIGDAIKTAAAELTSSRHNENARKVLVLLTDGDVTRPVDPATGKLDRSYASTYALNAASEAKAQEISIYTIGLGKVFADETQEVNRDVGLIQNIATDAAYYYTAPSIDDLSRVYQEISTSLCEDGASVIEVIAKPKTSFR
mgnify:FL=1